MAPGPNPVAYVDNPFPWCDPLGLMPKYPKERARKVADQVIERAREGEMRKSGNDHADTRHQFSDDRSGDPQEPRRGLPLPGRAGKPLLPARGRRRDHQGAGPRRGRCHHRLRSFGARGESGAKAFGGSPDDPGLPVTHDDIVNGNIPDSRGGTLAPADQIR
ncbi:hypothetical protein [Streptomyces sp. YPW6]|uniref:hypothetical protein n=1 Tax=Streptomyces sp. YPW6 TaxID=2840373 RepID=UPI003EB787EF